MAVAPSGRPAAELGRPAAAGRLCAAVTDRPDNSVTIDRVRLKVVVAAGSRMGPAGIAVAVSEMDLA